MVAGDSSAAVISGAHSAKSGSRVLVQHYKSYGDIFEVMHAVSPQLVYLTLCLEAIRDSTSSHYIMGAQPKD